MPTISAEPRPQPDRTHVAPRTCSACQGPMFETPGADERAQVRCDWCGMVVAEPARPTAP